MVDRTVLLWLKRIRSLFEETLENPQRTCPASATVVADRWPLDYLKLAREHVSRYMEGRLDADRILGFLKGLFCLAVVSHALRYLEQQDSRDKTRVTRSPIPLLCYGRLADLDDWPDMAKLMGELAEHIKLASGPGWESADLAFAQLLREQSQLVLFASREEIERALEITIK